MHRPRPVSAHARFRSGTLSTCARRTAHRLHEDEADGGQRRDRGERAAAPLGIEVREAAPQRADQHRHPDDPFKVIMTAAKTVSRASVAVSWGSLADTISVTISATSMTVTATASTSDPNGSPTRWATTSA